MKIAFNPSTVAALITPPNNKDITFDLRGRNIFARGVKFCGTDTNTWRDIKINNVSIGSNILDLRNGSNTTLTNTNGVVTINSTWRPVVDNLTSDSTTSSLSAKQGKVLKSLIDGKSNSGHTHDDRYLKLTGGTMASNALITFADSGSWGTDKGPQGARGGLYWTGQSDYAKLYAEETAGDNLDLVIQFGDDNSNGLSIRNKANTQTSYISAGGVITTGTFKGNLDWSYITNKPSTATRWPSWAEVTGKPSSFTPSTHTHGLSNSVFFLNMPSISGNAKWKEIFGYPVNYNLLLSVRINSPAPEWCVGNYGSGILYGGSDTKGFMSSAYNEPLIMWAGGNGSSDDSVPKWYIGIKGIHKSIYNLATIASEANAAYNLRHSHANKSVLDGITSALVNNWNIAYTFVNTITGTDTDKVINKWDEIVNFLAGITEDNKLNTLLNSKLSVYELANNTNVGTIKNNGIYYSTSDASSGTLTNSPFNTGFALINMTSLDNGDDLRRSRLAFNAYGEIKVSDDRDQANTAETWYNVLTSKNSGISGSTIKLNGTSITVYSSSTADGRYVKKSGDTMTGALNFANNTWNQVGDDVAIGDHNIAGCLGIKGLNAGPGLAFYNSSNTLLSKLVGTTNQFQRVSGNNVFNILDTSSTYTSNGKGVINGTTITQVDNATNSTNSTNARKLVNWYSARPTSLNAQFGDGSLRIFYATSSTTEGKPAEDSHILHLAWDNNGGWDTQLAVHTRSGKVSTRAQNSGTWQPWKTLAFTTDIPSSLKNPHALTISLNGTSQGPYDGSAAKNINITPGSIGAATSGHNHDGRYVYNYGGTQMDGASINKNALGMATNSGITGDWWHILQAAWNGEYRWNSQIAFPTQNRNGMYYRSGLDDNTKWGSWVKLLDVNNYSSTLDSRYYTESEVNNLLNAKLNRQNLSYGTWNPRGYNLAADYYYNGGDLSISESGGKIHVSVDGYFWQNEGQYRVLDTSDVAGLKNNLTVHQYLSNTDTTWWPLIWGGSSHNNTSDSTGTVYKSYDKLSWQTSSQTLYATHLRTTDLNTQTALFHPDNDSTLKIYSGKTQDAVSDGHIGLQTSIDNTDGQTHTYPTQYGSRCVLALQPRGGSVYIGNMPNGGNGRKLNVNGDIGLFNVGSIRDLTIGGGIYWNPYVESTTDGSDAASITLVKSGVAGGTTLVLSQMNDSNDTIQFKTSTAARLYHNSYPILTTQNTYVSGNKGYINGTEITQVNNADTIDGWHKNNIQWTGYITSPDSLSSYWFKMYDITVTGYLYNDITITFLISEGYSAHFSIFHLKIRQNGTGNGNYALEVTLRELVGNLRDKIVAYYNNSTGNVQLWGNTGGRWNTMNYTILKKTTRTDTDLSSIGTLTAQGFSSVQTQPSTGYTKVTMTRVGSVSYSDSTGSVHWNNVTNKPGSFTPAAHTHTVFRNNLMIKGTNGVSDSASIHLGIGDSDTGFKWISDGKCQIYANNVAVGEWTANGMNWFKNPTVNGNKVWNAGNDGSGSGLDADTVDGYHASSLWRSDGATWNPSANVSLTASGNNQEWSFDIRRNGYTGCYWHVWDSALNSMLKVNADNGKVYAPYNFVGNLEGNASSASKWLTARTFTIGNTSKNVDGSSNVSWSLSEIGAAPSSHSHNYAANENYGGFTKSGRLPISGFYQSNESESGGNTPWSGWMHLINCQHSNTGNNYALQIAASFSNNNTFKIRVTNNNVNNAWRDIIHSGNIGSQTVANAYHLRINSANTWSTWYWSGQSGQPSWLWGSNDGTNMYVWNPSNFRVAYASSAGNADTVDGYHSSSFLTKHTREGAYNIDHLTDFVTRDLQPKSEINIEGTKPYDGWGMVTVLKTDNGTAQLVFDGRSNLYFRSSYGAENRYVTSAWKQVANLSSNVASATKLQTARSIWGQSFNGTADVNGTIYINNNDSSNGAIRLNNDRNSNARISAISDQVIFNTGNAIRFGGTSWDWNNWAGLKYTHSNKTIYLGIADNSIFNANSAQSGGSLRFPGISNVYATTFNGSLSGNASTATNADKLDGTHLNGIFTAFGNNAHNITATIGGVTKSFLVNWAADSDKLDGYHENSFLRYRETTSIDQENTLWDQIGIKQYNGALPDNLTNVYNYGSVISLPCTSTRFEIYASEQASLGNGLYYRSGWRDTKRPWLKFIDSSNIGSQSVNYANSAGNADKLDGIHANGLLTALSNTNNGISITVGGTTKSVSNISVNYASSAGSATKVIVNQHTANDTNYPLVWSNQANSSTITENQLYKSWSDLYYNPKNKRLTVGGSVVASSFIKSGGTSQQLLRADGGIATFNWSGQSGQPTWLWGGNNQHSYYVYNPSNFRVAYATSSGNADTLDGEHAKNFVRAGFYENNDLNSLDTYSFIRSVNSQVSRTSPKGDIGWYNVIQLVHRNGDGDGPNYIGQIALGMTSNVNDIFFRCRRTDPWKTIIHSNNYTEFINNYYWANVKISTSSSTTTSPTVSSLTATSYIRMGNIYLQNTNEINSTSGIHLNYQNSGNISLCAGGGNVGIGTISPSYKLDVNGQVRASGFHHSSMNSDNYILLAGGGYKSFGGDSSHPVFLGYLNLDHGSDGTVSSSFSCLGYTVSFTYTRGGNYCKISIPDTTHQAFYIKAATASVNYSGGGMDTWTGNHRGAGAWWLHCYAPSSNEVRVKGFHLKDTNNDSWWGGNPLWSDRSGVNRITVCIFGYVTFR